MSNTMSETQLQNYKRMKIIRRVEDLEYSELLEIERWLNDRQYDARRDYTEQVYQMRSADNEPVTVYVDGGCEGNGTADARAYGSYKIGERQPNRMVFGADTSNGAEYLSLIAALEYMETHEIRNARICMDSKLVVNQVNGEWKAKAYRLGIFRDSARQKLKAIGATLEWVERSKIVALLGH